MKQISNVLENHQLEYEEMGQKRMGKAKTKATVKTNTARAVKRKATPKKVAKPTVSLKQRLDGVKKAIIVQFNNGKKKLGIKSKKAKKVTKAEQKLARLQKIRGIIGIGLLFVVVSIAYSTYMTVLFVDGAAMVVALAPQVVFAATILLIAFYKIYK